MRDGKAACAIVAARSERDRITAERLAAYIEYYLRRQTSPGRRCWGLTEEREGIQPATLSVGDPVPDVLGVILVGAEAAPRPTNIPPVPANGGTISIVEWQKRRALLVAGSSPELTEEEVRSALRPEFQRFGRDLTTNMLPKLPPGDWEAVSHSTFPIGRFLVTTLMLRRQQRPI